MRLTRQRILVIGVAATALVALTVSTALGGSSLKKLVKKEVAKQLSGKTGPAGPQGAQGPQGLQGPPGVVGRTTLTASSAFDSTSPKNASVTCPGSTVAMGGGASIFSTNPDNDTIALQSSRIVGNNQWRAVAYESPTDGDNWGIDVTVICANP